MEKRQPATVPEEATREDYDDVERTKAQATQTERLQEIEVRLVLMSEYLDNIQRDLDRLILWMLRTENRVKE